MPTLLALALAFASQSPAAAPTIDVAALLEPIRKQQDVPGLVGAILTVDGLQHVGACGVRERGRAEALEQDDPMHLGSCTKSMTATLCAVLVQEKKLDWDSRLTVVLLDLVPEADAGWSKVTLADLLVNRGGAPGDVEPDLWAVLWKGYKTPGQGRLVLTKAMLQTKPVAAPGERFVYSNAGFSLAGVMAESAAKAPFEHLLEVQLFEPLGMRTAGFGAPGKPGNVNEPRGHRASGEPVQPGPGSDNPEAIAPAGRVHCSVPDWAKYIALHLRGEKEGGLGLSSQTFVRLHAPLRDAGESEGDGYAMGWSVTERPWGGRVLMHNGSNTMWFCVAWLAPDKGFAVLAATNQGGDKAEKACDQASAALIGAWQKAESAAKAPK